MIGSSPRVSDVSYESCMRMRRSMGVIKRKPRWNAWLRESQLNIDSAVPEFGHRIFESFADVA